MNGISVRQLKQALVILERIEALKAELGQILGSQSTAGKSDKGGMTAAGRASVAAAQRARWAKVNAAKSDQPEKQRKKMSAKARAAISAAAIRRWQQAKASGKNSL